MQGQSRRTFLKYAGAVAIATGLPGCVTGAGSEPLKPGADLKVRVDAPDDPLVDRAFAILKSRVEERCSTRVVRSEARAGLVLAVDPSLPLEAYRIDEVRNAVRVSGGSPRGLLYGIGKFLRTSGYDDTLQLSSWRVMSQPRGAVRGMYFASHFHNWYHQATEPELARYMEDLTLWGANAVKVIFPMINLQGWDDPAAEPAMNLLRQYAKTAHALGLQFVTGINNTMFIGAPKEIRAGRLPDPTKRRGNHGHPICPSNPDGHAYLMENARQIYERLSDVGLDYVMFWPYDEGGCSCAQCSPWGSNGFLRMSRDLARLGREYNPKLKTILSTWMFDTPPEGEWQGLADELAKGNDWLDYILADAHEDFPRYPLENGVPGNLPLLNFPEISMWGNWPWGGYGAHPLPARFQRLWDQVKEKVSGGFPYSEGIYEDINKAVVLQFYWDRDRSAQETLKEYIAYEYGAGNVDDVLEIVNILEVTASTAFRKEPLDKAAVLRANQLAEAVNNRMATWAKANWRWEILYLRTVLDRERFAGGGLETPAAEAVMLRLIDIYHCQLETDDPYHHRVRPPLKKAVSRKGNM